MKKIIRLSLFVFIVSFGFYSCTKEETGLENEESRNVGKLSFGSVLSDLANRKSITKQVEDVYEIPECSSDSPLYVRVALKVKNENDIWEWFKNSNENKIEIEVNPNGSDMDEDGTLDAWFTQESSDLELEEGLYSLEYFAVASAPGNDPADIIYMAPRRPQGELDYTETIQYHNFVKKPLPITVKIRPGVKYYQPVEVLCYEEHYAFAFGYLFFDFNSTALEYLCVFGNVCDESQQHLPASFKIKVWKESEAGDLLVVAQNSRKSFTDDNGTHYYADALCFPLPKLKQTESFYAKIWLVEDDTETLIREGNFDSYNLSQIYRAEQEHYYYHFREGCCDTEDEVALLNDLTQNEGECEEEPQDPEEPEDCGVCDDEDDDGKVNELKLKYIGQNSITLTVMNKITGNNEAIIENITVIDGDIIDIPAEWNHDGHGNIIGNNLEFLIDGQTNEFIHVSCSEVLFLGKKTSLEGSEKSTENGNFEINYIKTSRGGECPLPPE
ncbi:hypothetical protein SAMN05444483_103146 [Salegentibacter echinorum]|uniref:Uncharacterized protein n=1 Tax=Salegentibacter echinorum TaxID=1073325 RepID=A0A1M5FDQ0_SALEC|nr:hypothetical protein [Salegentibacter echinorum]SHF89637.1 hypothetical protein SAMN05444483_103146 [Salegentibacter echinorum]